jgi:type IV pilus assembly protein PilA
MTFLSWRYHEKHYKSNRFIFGIVFALYNSLMKTSSKLRNRRGFSLVELMIVIAIVAIMSAIAIPFFGGFVDNRDLKSAARDIAGDIFELKERAIAEDRYYQITLDQGANNYVIRQCNDMALPCAGVDIATKSPSAFRNGIIISALNFPAGNVIQIGRAHV